MTKNTKLPITCHLNDQEFEMTKNTKLPMNFQFVFQFITAPESK